ncbi:uncharacterized protein [Lolium perenne]|uniref:uncharacterized protein n=1 Tax=Lolium perenne TaxID=4522 RepID=UPI003A99DA8A
MDWNIRGANSLAKRRAIQLFFADKSCNVVCLQETKIAVMTKDLVIEMLEPKFGDNFICLPADGTNGGVLIACTDDFQIAAEPLTAAALHSITGNIVQRSDNTSWAITGVYGPQEEDSKNEFMQELRMIQPLVQDRWMVLGDFNLICTVADKSNTNVNLRLMGQFRAVIQDLELIKYPLIGRRFTWSNERQNTTMTMIDRVFVSKDWDIVLPHFQLAPASSNVSDHCPLILSKMQRRPFKGFRFDASWLHFEDFLPVVQKAWEKPVHSRDAIRALHIKLARVAKALKKWSREKENWAKVSSRLASDIIFQLDLAQESRN